MAEYFVVCCTHYLEEGEYIAEMQSSAMPTSGNTSPAIGTSSPTVMVPATPECSDCENRCEDWIDKCKEGGQYACYKAAACLCKCNLDEGGCGSSKEALRECYEQNEKLARELGPPER